jgi:hypothetical protein
MMTDPGRAGEVEAAGDRHDPGRDADYRIDERLMCRFRWRDLLRFFLVVLPYALIAIQGMVRAGRGRILLIWLGYAVFFFYVWEARVLCRHCPFWAGPGKTLRCPANYGVTKLWRWDPRPMTRSEGIQFLAGATLLIAFPLPWLLQARKYLLTSVALAMAAGGTVALRNRICTRCVNFSCPLNAVPKPLVDEYLRGHPEMMDAWEACGYEPTE